MKQNKNLQFLNSRLNLAFIAFKSAKTQNLLTYFDRNAHIRFNNMYIDIKSISSLKRYLQIYGLVEWQLNNMNFILICKEFTIKFNSDNKIYMNNDKVYCMELEMALDTEFIGNNISEKMILFLEKMEQYMRCMDFLYFFFKLEEGSIAAFNEVVPLYK